MRIIRTRDYEDMSRKAANLISAVMTMKPDCVLGLATGSSPVGTYRNLIRRYENGDLDFSQVTTVNLDEYKGLDGENPQSYRYFMRENLFSHVNIDRPAPFFRTEQRKTAKRPAALTMRSCAEQVRRICSFWESDTTAISVLTNRRIRLQK